MGRQGYDALEMAQPPRKPRESASEPEEETLWATPGEGRPGLIQKGGSVPPPARSSVPAPRKSERPNAPPSIPIDFAPSSERTLMLAPSQLPTNMPNAAAQQRGSQPPPANHTAWNQPTGPMQIQQLQQTMQQMPQGPMLGPPQPIRLFGPTDPRLVLLNEPDSDRAASYRLLRDTLLSKRLPRVVAISSAAKKEGKTTCATNLALALAERGARTMLIDGNLWEPDLHKLFSIEAAPPSPMSAPWLAPYRVADLSRSLQVAGIVLPPGEPLPRFEKTWFEGLIGALYRINYDFIIIDGPALTVSPLVPQLVGIAEGVLLAVKSGTTTARSLRRAADQLPPGKGLGIALIDSAPNR